jgi:hypothetical protein
MRYNNVMPKPLSCVTAINLFLTYYNVDTLPLPIRRSLCDNTRAFIWCLVLTASGGMAVVLNVVSALTGLSHLISYSYCEFGETLCYSEGDSGFCS